MPQNVGAAKREPDAITATTDQLADAGIGHRLAAAVVAAVGIHEHVRRTIILGKQVVALENWFDGIIEGSGLAKDDPRLAFRKLMFALTRKQAGQLQRRRDSREHVTLYLTAFNAWASGHPLTRLRYTPATQYRPQPERRRKPDPGLGAGRTESLRSSKTRPTTHLTTHLRTATD